ncbi:hypothetical protein Plim_3933 [Planctopirus limnophila DSM 3776]|uniref:DUF1559 domain-containing protein n=1 Tax=Planctopirus limnophila (strain ATCC 43296 / DSM 3776 / IFAM 1008 / Mu 290) TaxID=521674 RepID=D5SXC2_PLAL2|nr:DUF1559 domain-containing protein [Planctopirus limnophila]ADG69744.1 hypothetical protein Plim_3933 [Planctopirus limnophila DSM 3776]
MNFKSRLFTRPLLFMAAVVSIVLAGLLVQNILNHRKAIDNTYRRGMIAQIRFALMRYRDVYGVLPPLSTNPKDGGEGLSWRVLILPFLGERELYSQFDLSHSWDSQINRALVDKMPERLFKFVKQDGGGKTRYAALSRNGDWGVDPTWDGRSRPSPNPIFLVESAEPIIWTRPQDITVPTSGVEKEKSIVRSISGDPPFGVGPWGGIVKLKVGDCFE